MSNETQNEGAPTTTQQEAAFEALRKWLENPSTGVEDQWRTIGSDVYARKYVLIAARDALQASGVPNPLKHAATDVLVEKAQSELTERATYLNISGGLAYLVALGVLFYGAWVLDRHAATLVSAKDLNGMVLTLAIFRASTSAALVFAAIYYLIALARALMSEGTLLLNRRHALRYLRLCVYLSEGNITLPQLRQMVNWNAEFATAFGAIDAERVTSGSPLAKVVDALGLSLKTLAKLVPEVAKHGGLSRKA